jgi:mitochondrial fission protein ELM1
MHIWIIKDDKLGHLNQGRGLAQALEEQSEQPTYLTELPFLPFLESFLWLFGVFPKSWKALLNQHDLITPDYVFGAGRRNHLSIAMCRLKLGATGIVLSKPNWPKCFFNYCVIPEHDEVKPKAKVMVTTGAMNKVRPSKTLDPEKGIILIGGESSHYIWDDEALIKQIDSVVQSSKMKWVLTVSRRTPDSFIKALKQQSLDIDLYEETPANWLPQQLAVSGTVWVTPDSVSMLYEALSSGGNVGLLNLTPAKMSRVARSAQKLLDDGKLAQISEGRVIEAKDPLVLDEATRIAKWILRQN